ncbi:nucleolin, partial [Exaiptasia diaphana]|uniref:Uncharacterized protein n=1 Tax=Exaiptasia diaphana TaxID=2652724 RepID=A0A913X200_EXADI
MAMMLIGAFLMADAPKCVPMNAMARKELIKLLPIDQGDAILSHESRNVVQGLMSPWLEYIRAEDDHFISSVTKPKKVKVKKTVPVQTTEYDLKQDLQIEHDLEEEEEDQSSDEESEQEEEISKLKKEGKKAKGWRSLAISTAFSGGYNDETSEEEEEGDKTEKV